jgi:hypothetical protein
MAWQTMTYREITLADFQAASTLEGLQQLFHRLGYDTSEPCNGASA